MVEDNFVEAVEDLVGGNNPALALKIAAEHPGMQPSSNTYYTLWYRHHVYNEVMK